jgi:hypothetical protein
MSNQGPGGTIYGRGGADTRPPRQGGLHPAVIALVGGAAAVLLLALLYWMVRDPANETPAAAGSAPASAPAVASPEATAAEASPSPSEPALSTGEWVLALAGDPERRLTEDDDFAALGDDDPITLEVVPGLADGACFSFRDEDGDYLRHFDFRLRFDKEDEADDEQLFRNDATFCPDGGPGAIRLRSKNYPQHLLHRRGSQLYIDEPDGTDRFAEDSTFTVRKPE